jgi:hypothetical protein
MTHDEIREALRLDFEQTADWRRSKAAEYPEDSRNLEAAALLDKLAASVETVAPDLLEAYGSLRDDYMDSEQHSEMFRQIGFHLWPETAEDFVKACIADRSNGSVKLGSADAEAVRPARAPNVPARRMSAFRVWHSFAKPKAARQPRSRPRSVWQTTLAIRSPPEATSLGVSFKSYLRGCRSTQPGCLLHPQERTYSASEPMSASAVCGPWDIQPCHLN